MSYSSGEKELEKTLRGPVGLSGCELCCVVVILLVDDPTVNLSISSYIAFDQQDIPAPPETVVLPSSWICQ